MISTLNGTASRWLMLASVIAVSFDPAGPCGPNALRRAQTVRGHVQAIGNHANCIAMLLRARMEAAWRG